MNKKIIFEKKPVIVFMAMLCCMLWGSAFPCIKLGNEWCSVGESAASKILFAGARFTLAGILAVIACSFIRGKPLIPKKPLTIRRIMLLSIFQTILQYIFFYIGVLNTSGVKSSIINAFNVFLTVITASFIVKTEKMTAKKLIGCIIGSAGVVLINLGGNDIDASFSLTGEGFILISTAAHACSSSLLKKFGNEEDPLMLSGWQFFFGGLVMVICGLIGGGHFSLDSGKSVGILLYLGFISAAAYSMWAVLLKYNDVSKISVFGFMNPIFGVILSAWLLRESSSAFSVRGIISLALVCTGIYIVNLKRSGKEISQENVRSV